MTSRGRRTTKITITTAVRRTGLSSDIVQECVERSLVMEPLSDMDLAELRRIRRLQDLGVNLQGIEIILHMRRRITALQVELNRWERRWSRADGTEADDIWQRRLPWDQAEK